MAKRKPRKTKTSSLNKILFPVIADAPDIRDRMYEPALIRVSDTYPENLPRDLDQWEHGHTILDQGNQGACTGFALAAVVNELHRRRGLEQLVSPLSLPKTSSGVVRA